jgi:hypothetical protein
LNSSSQCNQLTRRITKLQSAYHCFHFSETALPIVLIDKFAAVDQDDFASLIMPDELAVFVTDTYQIILRRLQLSIDTSDMVLASSVLTSVTVARLCVGNN